MLINNKTYYESQQKYKAAIGTERFIEKRA
jgi:hypothetical protein